MKRRIAVRAIIFHDGKLLALQLKKYPGSITGGSTYWCTPGGGVEEREALIPALERELVEELGVKPQVGPLLFIQQFQDNGTEHLEFFFQVLNPEDYTAVDLNSTTHGAVEIAKLAFIDPANEHLLPKFLVTEPLTELVTRPGAPKFFDNL